jgi:hypothetical protein
VLPSVKTKHFTGDLKQIIKRRVLRVLVVPDRMRFFFDGVQLRGAALEVIREFEKS